MNDSKIDFLNSSKLNLADNEHAKYFIANTESSLSLSLISKLC